MRRARRVLRSTLAKGQFGERARSRRWSRTSSSSTKAFAEDRG